VNASAPLVIAGATGYGAWPANSLEGALQCLAAPVDGIEIDVQMTLDGHVVAHHDYRLRPDQTRLEGQWIEAPSAPLKQLKLDSLRRYDVGRSRPGSAAAGRNPGREEMDGVRVPTLREIIDALKDATSPRTPRISSGPFSVSWTRQTTLLTPKSSPSTGRSSESPESAHPSSRPHT